MSDANQRFEDFVAAVARQAELWVLSDGESFALLTVDEEECLPLWADPAAATAWSTEEALKAKAIPLQVWLDRWVPGLTGDQTVVAVHPDMEGEAVVLSAEELAEAIAEARNTNG